MYGVSGHLIRKDAPEKARSESKVFRKALSGDGLLSIKPRTYPTTYPWQEFVGPAAQHERQQLTLKHL